MKQHNTSGATVHVPSLSVEVGPLGEIDHDELLAGFTKGPAPKPKSRPAKKAAEKKTPAPKPAADTSTADKE